MDQSGRGGQFVNVAHRGTRTWLDGAVADCLLAGAHLSPAVAPIRISWAYLKRHTYRQHLSALTGDMPDRDSPRMTAHVLAASSPAT